MLLFTLLFIVYHFFYLLYNKQLYNILQRYTTLLTQESDFNSNQTFSLLNNEYPLFTIFMVADLFYLLYCLWLLFTDNYWQQGGMLFLITSLETYAFHCNVAYTFDSDEEGFLYPKAWFRCFSSGLSIFILTRIYISL